MSDPVPQSQDHDLDRLVGELTSAAATGAGVSPLEERLVEAVSRLWDALRTARQDIDLLKEEHRGWSRKEMTIDQPDSPRTSPDAVDPPRQWTRGNMEIDEAT